MNDFEDRVRRALRTDVSGVAAERLLGDVHRGVGLRRRRRAAAVVAASALVVVGVVGVVTQLGGGRTGTEPPPATQSPSPTQPPLPSGAAQGVIDVSVVSPDVVFRLTTNVGCVACSTIWRQDSSVEGGWERLHDFIEDAYAGRVDPSFGPVDHLVMMADGTVGWAWGDRIFSTHDGGRTWAELTTGPGRVNNEYGHQIAVTGATSSAWSLLRTDEGTELWRTELASEDWERADAPDMSGVSGMVALSDYVLLETSDEGLSAPRLQYFRLGDGLPWGEVANPCPGENQVYPASSVAFMLCRSGNDATVYRLVGVEHPVAGEAAFQWYEFGRSSGVVTDAHALGDGRLLVVGRGGNAALITESGTTAVDLGTDAQTFQLSSADGLALLTTSDQTLLATRDDGLTWHEVE